jgi:hypothetical protein
MAETLTMDKDQLQALLMGVVKAAREPNAVEQRALQTAEETEKRKTALRAQVAQEEAKALSHKRACTHTRYPNGHKRAGFPAPRGQGDWTTGGQLVGAPGEQLANLICMRCSNTWQWKPTGQEAEYIMNEGMLGMEPPSKERIVFEG